MPTISQLETTSLAVKANQAEIKPTVRPAVRFPLPATPSPSVTALPKAIASNTPAVQERERPC